VNEKNPHALFEEIIALKEKPLVLSLPDTSNNLFSTLYLLVVSFSFVRTMM
jgi:hypothetical protein